MKVKICLLLISIFSFFFGFMGEKQKANAQQPTLVGPVLAGRVVGGGWITFEDVGLNKTWQIKLPNSSFVPQSWSFDGCNLLVQESDSWAILSVPNATIQEIPQPLSTNSSGQSFGNMIWSFDGKSLIATIQLSSSDFRIYSMNLDTFATHLILSLNKYGSAIRWLSETELLYQLDGGDYFVWDTVAMKSHLYKHKPQIPSDWLSQVEVYLSDESPNGELSARYYSVNALNSFILASQEVPPPDDISPEYIATLESVPKVPGFDIYAFNDASTNHINVMEQFLQFLKWSPSSNQIAVTTDPVNTTTEMNGIYVYSLADKSLKRIGVFPAMYNEEYGGYEPTWSPDNNSLSFNTPDGYIIYNLTTQKTTKLSPSFDGFYMSLEWSPIMDYSQTSC